MRRLPPLFVLVFVLCPAAWGQSVAAEDLEISLITCGPGTQLWSLWGHSMVRVRDAASDSFDYCFNYGIVPFFDSDLAMNFVRGNMIYGKDVESTRSTFKQYARADRWLREIKLDLNPKQAQEVFDILLWNIRPENNSYSYEFLTDNCSSRLRDVFTSMQSGQVIFEDWEGDGPTYRELLDPGLRSNLWYRLLINFMLNSIGEKKTSSIEAMFLPDYLEKYILSANIADESGVRPLALSLEHIEESKDGNSVFDFWYSPLVIFSLLFFAQIWLTVLKRNLKAFDFILFFISGLLGCLLVFVWTCTNHFIMHHNLNLIWTLPTHIAAAFFVFGNSKFKTWYFRANTVVLVLFFISLPFLPQKIPFDVFPLVLALFLRSFMLGEWNVIIASAIKRRRKLANG